MTTINHYRNCSLVKADTQNAIRSDGGGGVFERVAKILLPGLCYITIE